ncbi:MAG TPA: cation diffusion facilitator family transporter [Dongiaceae bacterium]|nr:cation diffusion facilitator family transporter [Dongiaceae bacterium]
MSHRHAHSPTTRRLTLVIALTAAFLLIETAGGVISRSLALLSDAGHMLTDLLALVLSLMAARFASLPPNPAKTYGYRRLEILTALVNGTVLVLVAGLLVWRAGVRFFHPVEVAAPTMIGVAVLGLGANLAGLWLLSGDEGLNIRGARMHLWGDALSSIGVVLGSIAIGLTGWFRIDSVVAGVVAVVIAFGALRLVREAIDVLLEAAPAGLALVEVERVIREVPGVTEVHDLHVWSITTGLPALSGHVQVDPAAAATPDATLACIAAALRDRFGITHSTLQIETADLGARCDVAH